MLVSTESSSPSPSLSTANALKDSTRKRGAIKRERCFIPCVPDSTFIDPLRGSECVGFIYFCCLLATNSPPKADPNSQAVVGIGICELTAVKFNW